MLLVAGGFGLLVHRPLLFASLGPTAYELVETPGRPSARPYNILVGHGLAILSALLALSLTHAGSAVSVSLSGGLSPRRIAAAVFAATLTVFLTLLARAMQPAAVSTTLLLALGSRVPVHDAALVFAGILLLTLVGEPLRRWRLRSSPTYTEASFAPPSPPISSGTLKS